MTPSKSGAPRLAAAAPLFFISVAFAGGILFDELWAPPLFLASGVAIVAAVGARFIVRRELSRLLVLVAACAVGSVVHDWRGESVAPDRIRRMCDDGEIASGEPVGLEGVVRETPEDSPAGLFFELETTTVVQRGAARPATGRVRVVLAKNDEDFKLAAGEKLRLYCAPNRADQFLNPGVAKRSEILERLELDAVCTLKSELLVERLAAPAFSPGAAIGNIRAALIARFAAAFDPPTAGVMIASLLGSKRYLDKSTATVFRDGGTFHVLVISGLHITFIGGLVFGLVGLATDRRTVRFAVTVAVLWTFSIAVGADVPVVRAALMVTVALFADVVFRETNQLNSLGLSALLLLAWRPDDVFSQSFQLTFASVAAIVAGAFPLLKALRAIGEWRPTPATPFPPNVSGGLVRFCETLYWREAAWNSEQSRSVWSATVAKSPFLSSGPKQAVLRLLFEGTLVSVIVQLTLLPLSVIFFNRVSVGAVLLNLWVGAVIAVETFAACAAIFVREFSETLALPLVRLTELLNEALLAIPETMIGFDLAGFRVPAYSGRAAAVYIIYAIPLTVIFASVLRWRPFDLRQRRNRWTRPALLALAVLAAVIVFHPRSAPAPDGRLRIDFLDVGQGDSALVTFPDGRTMLVDGGGRPQFGRADARNGDGEPFEPDSATIGEAVVSKFLWSRGLSRIDFVVATHADADHIQGLADVASNFDVGTAFFGHTPADDPDFVSVARILERRSVPVATIASGDSMEIGGVAVDVLWPETAGEGRSENNDSVVLRLTFGARSFLLTGDIEREAERRLVAGSGLAADVVKVPHHGSRTSSTSEFIAATAPAFAVISVGRTSRFGHPHAEVVDRWRARGAKTMTTGERGTITVSTDGSELVISRFQPENTKNP